MLFLSKPSTDEIQSLIAQQCEKPFSYPETGVSRAPIAPDTAVAVLVRHFGFWSLNFCRIVYVIYEDGPVSRYGFAYCTLQEHFESGEEQFVVEWDRSSDVVHYEISSFSRPGKLATCNGCNNAS